MTKRITYNGTAIPLEVTAAGYVINEMAVQQIFGQDILAKMLEAQLLRAGFMGGFKVEPHLMQPHAGVAAECFQDL